MTCSFFLMQSPQRIVLFDERRFGPYWHPSYLLLYHQYATLHSPNSHCFFLLQSQYLRLLKRSLLGMHGFDCGMIYVTLWTSFFFLFNLFLFLIRGEGQYWLEQIEFMIWLRCIKENTEWSSFTTRSSSD